jgi:hypothetical protein
MTPPVLGGIPVVVSDYLPLTPSVGENARRIVRHGLADVLAWLGEEVGPKPNEETHVLLTGGQMLVSAAAFERLKARL